MSRKGYKNKEEYIAFRAEEGTSDNLAMLRMFYDYSSTSHLLRMIVTRVLQLHSEGINICYKHDYNTVVDRCGRKDTK